MCKSETEGGRRCAAHTRGPFESALNEVNSAPTRRAHAHAQALRMGDVAAHVATPKGAVEAATLIEQAKASGNTLLVEYLASCTTIAEDLNATYASREADIAAATSGAWATIPESDEVADWDPGTPSVDVGAHWSIAEGGDRWHAGGCGAFAIAMTERWPHLKIAAEMYHDHGAESVAHAWAYDPATNTRFHIFGAEQWEPTIRPDYDPESHRVLLDQSPDDVRRLFRGFNTSEDAVYDALEVACEQFDPDYVADDEYDRNHLYF